jgi:hypothetical protein
MNADKRRWLLLHSGKLGLMRSSQSDELLNLLVPYLRPSSFICG